MEQPSFSIEETIEKFKNKGLHENDVNLYPYYSLLNNKAGISVFTERKISFITPNQSNNDLLEVKDYRYNIISKAHLYITNKENYLIFFYQGFKSRIDFPYKRDILEVKNLLEEYLAFKLKIEKLEGSSKIFLNDISPEELFSTQEEEIKPNIFQTIKRNFFRGIEKIKKRYPFLIPNSKSLKKIFSYTLIVLILSILISQPQGSQAIKEKTLNYWSYTTNIMLISQVKKDFDIIAFKLHQFHLVRKAYPNDFEKFMKEEFKAVMAKDPSKDPWGNTIDLKIEADVIKLVSYGPDGLKNNFDDVVKSYLKDN